MDSNLPLSGSSTKSVSVVNMSDSCRVCMSRCFTMSELFEETKKNCLIDKIMFCTGLLIEKHDGLPSLICSTCLSDLNIAHKFKSSCLLSEDTYQKLLVKPKVKDEVAESNSDYEMPDMQTENEFAEERDLFAVDTKLGIKDELLEAVLKEKEDRPKLRYNLSKMVVRKKRTYKKKLNPDGTTMAKATKQKPTKISLDKDKPNKLKIVKGRRLYCHLCDIKFDTKKLSDEHKKLTHKEDHWICEICGKAFVHRSSHYSHVRSHLAPQYACAHCDYKTWHKYDLVKHLKIHAGVKEYQCEFCTASYYASSNLTSHIQRNHQGIKKFKCPLCDHQFYERSKLQRHLDSHYDIKRFECEVCHSLFSRRCYWKKHLQRQHGIELPTPRPGRRKTNIVVGAAAGSRVVPMSHDEIAPRAARGRGGKGGG